MKKQRVFVIGGPTASGKSALAMQLAAHVNGSIVNGDAIQVYKDLSVLSARPTREDMEKVPHYLYGEVDAWTNCSLADWLKRIQEVLPTLKNPIVVGGTGMYLDALMNGISPIPDIPDEIRQKVRSMTVEEVKSMVKDCVFTDPQRMKRALEVQLATGKSIRYFQKLPKNKMISADFILIHVLPSRELIYKNCEVRFKKMQQSGAIDEVRHLRQIKATGGVMKAIGVSEIIAYLDHQITATEMVEKSVIATRQYAKRQMTWFRHHGQPNATFTDISKIDIENITK